MIQFKSLSTQTLLKMVSRISGVIFLITVGSYIHLMRNTQSTMKENVSRYINERSDREKILFDNAEKNHEALSAEFIRLYKHYLKDPKTPDRFEALVKPYADGTLRNRDPQFDGQRQAGIFIGKHQALSLDFKARVVTAYEISDHFGLAYHGNFQDTYFTFPENSIVLYWPEFPKWVFDTKETADITQEEYHLVSTPEKNPLKKTAWTGLFYDQVSKTSMVTAGTPIYVDNKYVASVHHDVMVNEVFERTIEDRISTADNYYIVRGDGRLILHPDHLDEIKEMNGQFDIMKSKDETLKSQFQQIMKIKTRSDVIESTEGSEYIAVAKIEGPDWYLVTTYPKSLIQKVAAKNAMFILLAGLLSLMIQVVVLHYVLKDQVAAPLVQLIQASNKIARGHFSTPIDVRRKDELGELAESFNQMAVAIQERDQKLEIHAKDLEHLVEERTRELDEQKMINMQATKMSALGEMAGGIAHEINTPLATIRLLTSQLINEIKNDVPDLESLLSRVQKIENTTDRVAKIVKGLKTFARDGSSDPLDECHAHDIVKDTFDLCSEQLRIHQVELTLDLPLHEISLSCRSVQISQVLLNLISNAQDAIDDQPQKWIQVQVRETAEWIEFRVIDSGSGVPKEQQEKIFQPFFTTKAVGKGTGMGLSISLGIIKSHHGELFIDNTNPQTCFVVRLPRSQKEISGLVA